MYAFVTYVFPVDVDVLGLVLVLVVVEVVCVLCWRVNRVPPGPPPELQGKWSEGHEDGEAGT